MPAFARDPDEELPPADEAGQDQRQEKSAGRSNTELLLAITDLISGGDSLPELFNQLTPLLWELTECELVNFVLYDSTQKRMVNHFRGKKTEMGLWNMTLPRESPEGWAWEHQQPLTIPDLNQETRFTGTLSTLRTCGIKAYTVLPLSTQRRRFGALGIGRSESGMEGPLDLAFLEQVARLMALAVENRQIQKEWQEHEDRSQSLAAISLELSSTLELEKLIQLAFARMRQITNYDLASLVLLEADGRSLRIRAADPDRGEGSLLRSGQLIPLAGSTSGQAIETRSIIFRDTEWIDNSTCAPTRELCDVGIRSICCVPLLMGSRALGTLLLGATRENAFSQGDGQYMQLVATQIAAAIHNATAYQEVEQARNRLAHEKRYLENEIRERSEDIVGNSSSLKRVLDQAAIVANTDATVLITGETGTGKERVARAIHLMSSRRDRSFIKLNCAAIPTGLLESELFGHEKGAFTGAVSQKVGRLELADKGTLLLDEVGEIALELQPKLLRVLQDQEFERLGGTKTMRVDVRVLAASNRDLVRAVEEKEFRGDLFYRLHVFPLHLPPLRERREDIPLLIRHFVAKCAARMNKRIDFIPDEAVEAMMHWRWPGNIRELENFIERSVILSEDNRLCAPLAELRQEPARRHSEQGTLRDLERDHIIEILRHTRGVLSGPAGAAARLGLKRTTLQYKIQKLGISRSDYLD